MTRTPAHIFRHPAKAHGREAFASVLLSEGACLPRDRHRTVTDARSRLEVP
ncbi:MAG: hypothetical protein H5U17_05780 [Defluviimonas sp.]|nr:hypothetical protein [Defluviimonas sp.]